MVAGFEHFISEWRNILTAVGVALLAYMLLRLVRRGIIRSLEKATIHLPTRLDQYFIKLAQGTSRLFLIAISLYLGALVLQLSDRATDISHRVMIIIALVQFAGWGFSTIGFWIDEYVRRKAPGDATAQTVIGLLKFITKCVLCAILFLVALNNLGVNITAFIASLGVGGIAVALAAQNILSDLFASLTIVLDKPFVIGDAITVGDFSGTIERVGLKTTRVRATSGEQVIFANNDLLQSRIRNFQRMRERRVATVFNVAQSAGHDRLKKVPEIIREVIQGRKQIRFERCHLLKFGPSSVDFEVVYWVETSDFLVHANASQEIHLAIYKKFSEEGIDFAPAQSITLKNSPVV